MAIGVIVVTYNARDVITRCLASLAASEGVDLRILIVDNASSDGTAEEVRAWAQGRAASDDSQGAASAAAGPLLESASEIPALAKGEAGLVRSAENRGFAGGVNIGLRSFLAMDDVDSMWILNPDCVVEKDTARHLVETARACGAYGVVGGRIFYQKPPLMIQSDGGRVNLWTGTCHPLNQTRIGRDVPPPPEHRMDYIVGAHMLVSRQFVQQAGLMPERYFLFYEEVEWCLRRGSLPLLFCPQAVVHHLGGHSIGSATVTQGPSPLSAYFMARNRIRFVATMRPVAVPVAFAYGLLKALRCLLLGQTPAGLAMLRGLFGRPPGSAMLQRINRRALPAASEA